jgi:hypothetical protein
MHTRWRIVAPDGTMPKRWRNVATTLVAISVVMALLLGVIPAWYAPSNALMFAACAPAVIGLSLWFIDYAARVERGDDGEDDDAVIIWRDHIAELVIAPCLLALFAAVMAVLFIAIVTHFIFYSIL